MSEFCSLGCYKAVTLFSPRKEHELGGIQKTFNITYLTGNCMLFLTNYPLFPLDPGISVSYVTVKLQWCT